MYRHFCLKNVPTLLKCTENSAPNAPIFMKCTENLAQNSTHLYAYAGQILFKDIPLFLKSTE